MAEDSTLVLAENVIRLMAARGDTQTSVAERGGISQRAVGYLVTYGKTHNTAPTVRTVDGIAKAFKVPTWLLFIPDMPLDLLSDGATERLLYSFRDAPADGRVNITRVAEAEVRYASMPPATRTGTGN